ncbi:3'-to-5' exoribonuclease RNase R [Streptococcus oralis]|uniref:3'-to-5' exoribonuclease RNase R n=1 Tax=Streptococcus oralis TaxID=1303 RepID=A0A139P6C6_STROR|nr:3'-to-5' exoribonuclease RNase R [Streptococcus oralis]
MKDKIKEYLQEKGRVTVNDLAQALEKDGSKDFRELIKTLSLMERKHQIRFEDDGSLCLDQKKKHEITLKGIFHAHKNGFGFVSLEGEEDDLFVRKKRCQLCH